MLIVKQIGTARPPVGSRPLTVGEIAANWLDGGHLRDTVRVKYSIDRKDPLPILRRKIIVAIEKQAGAAE